MWQTRCGHSLKALNNHYAPVLNTYLEAITTALKFGIKNYLINAIDQATTGKNHLILKN